MNNAITYWIRIEVDRELMPVVPDYLAGRLQDCAEIERLLASGGMERIQTLGHRMKGSGGSFGFDDISVIGEILESAAQIPDAEAIRSAVSSLQRYLTRVTVSYV